MTSTQEIDALYLQAAQAPSDINEHVAQLRRLGEQCEHITEFGVRMGTSTTAWVAARPKALVCYDIDPKCSEVERLEKIARELGTDLVFHQQDTLLATIDPTDLLFIDTLHTYDQLRQELALHAHKARKFIVMHDTSTFGQVGWGGAGGLWPAVTEFLAINPQWVIRERWLNNNGLTVLVRA